VPSDIGEVENLLHSPAGRQARCSLHSSEALLLDRGDELPVEEERGRRIVTDRPGSVDTENDRHIARA
jgi:hypothetical protein